MPTDETENNVSSDNQPITETHTDIQEEKGVLSTTTHMQESDSDTSEESESSETVALDASVQTNTLDTLYEDELNKKSTAVTDIDESISSDENQHEKNSHKPFPTDENFPTEETTSTVLSTEIENSANESENEDETQSTIDENENESSHFNSSEATNNVTIQETSEQITANENEDLTEKQSAESDETDLNTQLTNNHNQSTTHTSHVENQEGSTSHVETSSENTKEEIKPKDLTTSTNFEEQENRTSESTEENSSLESLSNQLNEHTTELETSLAEESNITEENNTSSQLEHFNETSESTIKESSDETSSETESAEIEINSESIEKLNQTEEHLSEVHTTASYVSETTIVTLESSVEHQENETTITTHEVKSEGVSEETDYYLKSTLEEEISTSVTGETEVTEPQELETYPTSEEANVHKTSIASIESYEVETQSIESYKQFESSLLENKNSKSEHHDTSTMHTNIGSVHTDLTSLNTSHETDSTSTMVTATHEIEKQPLDFETPACDYCDQISDLLKTQLDTAKNSESSNEPNNLHHAELKSEKTIEHSVSHVLTTIEMEKNVIEIETTPCLYCTTYLTEITKENQEKTKHSSQPPVTPWETEQPTIETSSIETTLAEHGYSEGGTKYETHIKKETQSKPTTVTTTKGFHGEEKSSKVTEYDHSTEHTSKMAIHTKEQNKESSTPSSEQANETESETTNENIFTSSRLYHSTNHSQVVNDTASSTEKILATLRRTEEELPTTFSGTFKTGKIISKTEEVNNGFHNPIIFVVKVYQEQKLNKSILEKILSSPLPEVSIEYADLRTENNEQTLSHTENNSIYEESIDLNITPKEMNTHKYVELKHECNKEDFENGKSCFCNISDYLTTLERKVESNEHIKSKVNYCNTFFKVKKLILKKTSSPRTYRSLIALDHTKSTGNLEFEGIEGIFEHNFDLPHKGRNFYNLPSETIKIPCTNDSTNSSSDKEMAYSWTFHPLSAATSQTLPDKSKDITLHGLSLSKAGNYTCTIMQKELIEAKVWHKLEIITFPIYEIKLNIFYRINDSCSLQTGDDLKTYLPKVISPILCANKREICHLDMERPRCLTREDDNYYNVSIQVKTSADVVFLIESNCDINCKLAFYENIVSMIYRNAEIVEHISVRSEINSLVETTFTPHLEGNNKSAVTTKSPQVASICPAGFGLERSKQRVCVTCPKNTFSKENQSFCRICPSGQYQPNVGSEFCIPCNSPVDDTMCLRMLYTSTTIFKIYVAAAFGIVTILIIVIIIWTSGMKDNPDEKTDYFEESLVQRPTNKIANRGANARIPPQIPPPDF